MEIIGTMIHNSILIGITLDNNNGHQLGDNNEWFDKNYPNKRRIPLGYPLGSFLFRL
jgi:hypothetical protein